jgi:hypothetical protein
MNPALQSLLARHLRFHRHLLALWRHTAMLAHSTRLAEREPWIEQRQRLLANLRACDGPRLTADTHALLHSAGDHPLSPSALCASAPCAVLRTSVLCTSVLCTLQQRELSLMQSLLSLERVLLRAFNAQRLALARRLLSAQRAGAACSAYRRRGLPAPRPPSRTKPPLTG